MRGKPDPDAMTGEQNAWASRHDMDAQDLTPGGPAPGERIVRTTVMSTPTTPIHAVAREVAAAGGTILGADASADVRFHLAPKVVEASATCCVPLQGGYGLPFRIVGRPLAADSQGPYHGGGGWMTVSPGYFEVFKIPVKRGRTFNERDTGASTKVVVIRATDR